MIILQKYILLHSILLLYFIQRLFVIQVYSQIGMNTFYMSQIFKLREKTRRSSNSSNHHHHHHPSSTMEFESSSKKNILLSKNNILKDDSNQVHRFFFEQRLDHFASHPCDTMSRVVGTIYNNNDCYVTIPMTFQQQFFYSNRFVQTNHQDDSTTIIIPPTYAFLCIGGEGPSLDTSVLIDSIHCTGDMIELAATLYQNHGASVHLFSLEHRYYGLSYPIFHNHDKNKNSSRTSPVSNHHLIYLSSRQALSDLVTFITYINNHPDFFASTSNIPWIAFGGSYPGMLAAWLRLKFPHVVLASVSHSAPIQVVENFYQYKEKVAWDLAYTDIGGSTSCLNRVQQGHEELYRLLTSSDSMMYVKLIADMFQICNGTTALSIDANLKAFLGDGVVDIPAQENDPNCKENLCNVQKICNFLMTFQGDDTHPTSYHVQALAALSNAQIQASSSICKNIDWNELLSFLSSPDAQIEGTRSWLWQTCTEVGFFQTCLINSTCPFGRGLHDIQQDLEICRVAFGISSALVRKNVEETLAFYGGWILQGTNILSINGNVDPWSTMAAKSSCADINNCVTNTPSIWVEGASHHFWTHKSKETDSASTIKVREDIHNWVMDILFRYSTQQGLEMISVY